MVAATTTSGSSSPATSGDVRHRYCVYGIAVTSDTPLALPEYSNGAFGDVEFVSAPAAVFITAMQGVSFDPRSDSWYRYASLVDGSTYVRWETIGEFLVADDGRRVICRREDGASFESFQVYLLGQALSFALVKQGFEPLHATVVVVDRQGVAFLGSNASGKSTLAACFLEAGYRLLTDDLLILQPSTDRVLAYPGPPRIKLFPATASRFLGDNKRRDKMNADTSKLILPIDEDRSWASSVTLKTIYSLAVPRDVGRSSIVSVEPLSPREAFVALLRGTFNRRLVNPDRLERQFGFMASLAEFISVKKLTYPRAIERLPEVRDMIVADLARVEMFNGGRRWHFPSLSA